MSDVGSRPPVAMSRVARAASRPWHGAVPAQVGWPSRMPRSGHRFPVRKTACRTGH